jgi:hypothetical protein
VDPNLAAYADMVEDYAQLIDDLDVLHKTVSDMVLAKALAVKDKDALTMFINFAAGYKAYCKK